ncbi:MAG TPA: NAD-dependent epimerase/dehydratase family protein, partial [Candidatus Xenobia bacterium]
YGCSKGAADQYVHDYARTYGMTTTCFRQSCIYGRRQFGIEDQGWVAWFTIAAVLGRRITLYGNGKQVRDVLDVDDLCRLYDAAVERPDVSGGQIFNVGGGPLHQLSLLELVEKLERLTGHRLDLVYANTRVGDQPLFVSDISKAQRDLQWQPAFGLDAGLERLYRWIFDNRETFAEYHQKPLAAAAMVPDTACHHDSPT